MPSVLLGILSSTGVVVFISGIGFACKQLGIFKDKHREGLLQFLANIALPCLFFRSLATLEAKDFDAGTYFSLVMARGLVFVAVAAITYATTRDQSLGAAGIYALFATQQNDFAMGLPIISAAFGPKYVVYLFLIVPFQLLALNVASISLLEVNAARNPRAKDSVDRKDKSELGEGAGFTNVAQLGADAKELEKEDSRDTEAGPEAPEGDEKVSPIAWRVVRNLTKSPLVMSILFGLFYNLVFGPDSMPYFFERVLETIGGAFAPLALFMLGLSIEPGLDPKYLLPTVLLVMSKALILPIVAALLVQGITGSVSMTQFALIFCMIPTAATPQMLALAYDVQVELISGASYIVVLASIPLLMITGTAIESGESSSSRRSEIAKSTKTWILSISLVSCAVILTLGVIARAREKMVGCWRLVIALVACTACSEVVSLACVAGNDLDKSTAISLSLLGKFFYYASSGCVVALVATLAARVRGDAAATLKIERWSHLAYLSVAALLTIISTAPGIAPQYVTKSDGDMKKLQACVQCATVSPVGQLCLRMLFGIVVLGTCAVYIIRVQHTLGEQWAESRSSGSTRLGVAAPTNDEQSEDSKQAADYKLMDSKADGPAVSDTTSWLSTKHALGRFQLTALVTCAGITSDVIFSIAELVHAVEGNAAFSQIMLLLNVIFVSSRGAMLLFVWWNSKNLQRGLLDAWQSTVMACPCLEFARLRIMSCFMSLDVMPGVAEQNIANYRDEAAVVARKKLVWKRLDDVSKAGTIGF